MSAAVFVFFCWLFWFVGHKHEQISKRRATARQKRDAALLQAWLHARHAANESRLEMAWKVDDALAEFEDVFEEEAL